MKQFLSFLAGSLAAMASLADDFQITGFGADGSLTFGNGFTNGVVIVEQAATVSGPWAPVKNSYTTDPVARLQLPHPGGTTFFRAQALDLTGPAGFTNLTYAYGELTTVAGAGGSTYSPNNKWQPSYEGGLAVEAQLSRPHIAMADRAGNIYIADKEAHAIRKVTPDGLIHTVAGTGVAGRGTNGPAPATTVALNNPNGLWVFEDGSFYILDRDNGLIRKVDTNGIMTTVLDNDGPIPEGRGLWVSPDESLLYYSAGTEVKRWDTIFGLEVYGNGFYQLGNLAVDPLGRLVVTDRSMGKAYRFEDDGSLTVIAGNGSFGGGDGDLATNVALYQLRGIWFLASGAFFLATDNGSQVWYVDTDGYIHLLLNGDFYAHSGDGAWFYDPSARKVSKIRQITLDYDGNLLITENDAGYIRKVRFLPYASPAP